MDYSHLDDNELDRLVHHLVPMKTLLKLCNPWQCWAEQEHPITPQDVKACIERNEQALIETPLWTDFAFGRTELTEEDNRIRHIQKIAWFVVNGFDDPISLEVGSQSLGVLPPEHIVDDGNHRLAAAIMRKEKTIKAKIGGSCRDAQEMGLWAPNDAYIESEKRWEDQQKRQRAKMRP